MSTHDSGKTLTFFTPMSPKNREGRIFGMYMLAVVSLISYLSLLIVPLGSFADFLFLIGFTTMVFTVVSAYKVAAAESQARTNLRESIRSATEDHVNGSNQTLSDYIVNPSGLDDNGLYVDTLSARQLKWINREYSVSLSNSRELQRRRLNNKPALDSMVSRADNNDQGSTDRKQDEVTRPNPVIASVETRTEDTVPYHEVYGSNSAVNEKAVPEQDNR